MDLTESGACSFWTVRLLASDLANLADDQARRVTGELIGKITERIQAGARPWTGSQIRAAAKRLIARLCPKDATGARARAWEGRRVQVWPRDHGMSVLAATISDADAHRIVRRLTKQAAELSDPERTRDQKRADVLADILLTSAILQPPDTAGQSPSSSASPSSCPSSSSGSVDGRADDGGRDTGGPDDGESVSSETTTISDGRGSLGGGPGSAHDDAHVDVDVHVDSIIPADASGEDSGGVAGLGSRSANIAPRPSPASSPALPVVPESGAGGVAEVCVVVKLETLLGLVDDSAEIPGVGPIPADTARELAAAGKGRAWITNSAGTVTATSSGPYRPSPALARLVRAREPYCRMPGCRTPASRCDLEFGTRRWRLAASPQPSHRFLPTTCGRVPSMT